MVAGFGNRRVVALWGTALAVLVSTLSLAAPAHAIAAPTSLSPTGPVSTSTPTLSWRTVPGAVKYEVQVDDTPDFESPRYSQVTTNTKAVPTSHLPSGDSFWRVRSVAATNAKSDWAAEQFSIDPTTAPSPISPVDGAALMQPDEPPLFTWTPVAGAIGYEIEVDVDGDWISSATYAATGTSFMIPTPQAVGTWSWRVRAKRAADLVTLWSDPATYAIQPLADVRIDPSMETGTPIQDVVLDWLPVPGAVSYEVQVGLDQDFTNLVEGTPTTGKKVFGTRYSPLTTYDNDQFFWRVRAVDAGGTKMPWPTVPFEFQRNWPDKPTLLHPADQLAPSAGDPFYYQWTPVPHATRYQLDVGTDANFSPNTYKTCETAGTTYAPGAGTSIACMPGQGVVTYWRVRARDEPKGVQGLYSPIRRVVYDSGRVTQTAPVNGSTVAVPTLKWLAARDAEKYFVELRDNTDNVVDAITTYSLSWTPDGSQPLLPADGPFHWSVQSVDHLGSKSPQVFSGAFNLAGTPSTTGAAPLTPLTGVVGNSPTARFPALTWEPMAGAQYYRLQIGVAGSGFWLNSSTSPVLNSQYPYPAATDIGKYFLSPGSYDWQVLAYNDNDLQIGSGAIGRFTTADLPAVTGQRIALDGLALDNNTTCAASLGVVVSEEDICVGVPATPVLDWSPVPEAAFYMVYLANDRELTNRVFTGSITSNTRWTLTSTMAKEALADNQAGQAYYWYIRPCKAVSVCAVDPVSTSSAATNAFRKISPGVELLSPADNGVASDDITFSWRDYSATNRSVTYSGGAQPSHQTASAYRIEISQSSTFTPPLADVKEVDQATYTPFDGTLPEGDLYWRVQAIDAEGNHLNWGPVGLHRLSKQSGVVSLTTPASEAKVDGSTPFEWEAKNSAASYSIEVYKNNDTTFSTANRVFTGTSKQAAFAWTKYLPASINAYLWRVRWTDGDAHVGGWSSAGRFLVTPGKVEQTAPASGSYQPAAGPYFTWGPVANASKYFVEVRLVGSTSSLIRTSTVAQAFAATTSLGDGSYEWRTTAYDPSNGVLAQSGWRGFRVDGTRPVVTSKSPRTTAKRTANFVAKFSERVKGVTSSTMKLYVAGRTTALPARVTLSASGRIATLNPSANLVVGKVYTVKLLAAIKDSAGNRLVATSWKAKAK